MKNNKTNHNKKILIKIASTIFTCYFLMITILPYNANNIYAIDESKYEDNSYNNALYILSIFNQNGIYLNMAEVNEKDYKTIYNYLVNTTTYATYLLNNNNNTIKSLIQTALFLGIENLTNSITTTIDANSIKNFFNNCYGVDWLAKEIEIFCNDQGINQTTFKIYASNYSIKTNSSGLDYVNEFLKYLSSKYNLINEGSTLINIKEGTTSKMYAIGGYIRGEGYYGYGGYKLLKNESPLFSLDLINNKYYIYGMPTKLELYNTKGEIYEISNIYTLQFYIMLNDKYEIEITNSSTYPYYKSIFKYYDLITTSDGFFGTVKNDDSNGIILNIQINDDKKDGNEENYAIGEHLITNTINLTKSEINEEGSINLQWNNLFGNYLQLITENQFLQMDYMEILSDENLMNYEKLTDIEKLLNDLLYVQMSNQTYNYNSSTGTTYNYFNTYIFDSSDNSVVNNSKYFITNKNTEIKNEYNTYNNIENNYIQELENLFNDLDLENDEKFNLSDDTLTATNEFKNLIEYTYNKMSENGMSSLIGIPLILSIIGMIIK